MHIFDTTGTYCTYTKLNYFLLSVLEILSLLALVCVPESDVTTFDAFALRFLLRSLTVLFTTGFPWAVDKPTATLVASFEPGIVPRLSSSVTLYRGGQLFVISRGICHDLVTHYLWSHFLWLEDRISPEVSVFWHFVVSAGRLRQT